MAEVLCPPSLDKEAFKVEQTEFYCDRFEHLIIAPIKSICERHGDPPDFPTVHAVDLFKHDKYYITTLYRDGELGLPMQPWSWRGMIKSMQMGEMDLIVGDGNYY